MKFILLISILSTQIQAKTLINCSEASPASFNPQQVADAPSFNASSIALYDRLVRFELGTTKMVPSLAESYSVSKDGKTYIFNLRKGVKFHTTNYFKPTREMNADDVLFSINRQRLTDHPFYNVGGGVYPQYKSNIKDNIKSAEAVTPYQVKITLNQVQAPFLSLMAGQFMSVLSAEYADKLTRENKKEKIDQEPIGTGPFIFQSYVKDNAIKYTANEDYWRKNTNPNKVDKLIFAITPDASVRYQKLKTGECHFVTLPAIADLDDMRANKNVKLESQEGLNLGYLGMNTTKKPFDNVKVRMAIAHALNKKQYLDIIYHGTGFNAKNPLPPTVWSYDNSTKDYDYNPELSKKLLKEAGFPNGFETEMWTLPVARPYNPDGKKMGELIQSDLAKVGIKVKLTAFDWQTFLAKSRTGEQSMIQFGWTGNSDPDTFLGDLLSCKAVESGGNTARWCNKEFDKLVTDAVQITDQKKRTDLYLKAQKVFKKEVPWVTLFHAKVFRAMSPKVKNFKIDPFGYDYFDQVNLE